jgi:PPOX class probable FMN-dependent enzyme
MAAVDNVTRLRAIMGEPSGQVACKIHERLNQRARDFVARSPMLFLATVDAAGQPTVSPKGDAPGFVRVVDDHTLQLPERKGNKLVFSLQNILANPRVALIFLVPGTGETLRVSGSATLLDDAALCASFAARDKPALLVTQVAVNQCYFHCAKAFLRSGVWKPDTWAEEMRVSFGQEIAEQGGLAEADIEAFDHAVHSRYRTDL